MDEPSAPLLARALKALRILWGWSQGDLAREAGLDRSTIRRLEAGDIDLPRERLEGFGVLMQAKPGQVEKAIEFAATEDAPEEESPAGTDPDPRDALIESALAAANSELRRLLEARRRASDLEAARAEAAERWRVLAPLSPENRLALVEECREFPTPALCARLCDESERAAFRSVADTLALAKLALQVADRLPASVVKVHAQGYAFAFLGNSLRVANEFGEGDLAFAQCRERFPYELADPTGLFPQYRVLDREASLRRNEGRLGEALSLVERALTLSAPADRARILLNQAATFEQNGEPERALAALKEAQPRIPHTEDRPRLLWLSRFSEVKILLALNQPRKAEEALPELRRLGAERGDRLSFLRLRWLEACVAAELGDVTEALVDLTAVRRSFTSISLPVDAAGVGLYQAEILLRLGQTSRVRALLAELKPTLTALNLKLEALAALRLFVEAAECDAATVEMVRAAAQAICRLPRHG